MRACRRHHLALPIAAALLGCSSLGAETTDAAADSRYDGYLFDDAGADVEAAAIGPYPLEGGRPCPQTQVCGNVCCVEGYICTHEGSDTSVNNACPPTTCCAAVLVPDGYPPFKACVPAMVGTMQPALCCY